LRSITCQKKKDFYAGIPLKNLGEAENFKIVNSKSKYITRFLPDFLETLGAIINKFKFKEYDCDII